MGKIEIITDLVYNNKSSRCTIDLFKNEKSNNKALIVFFHGGAWSMGDRQNYYQICIELTKLGYTTATIGYRFFPEVNWEGIKEDSITALDYLIENQNKLKINCDKIITAGSSAGGHIVLMLNALSKEWIDKFNLTNSPNIIGTIAYYPPSKIDPALLPELDFDFCGIFPDDDREKDFPYYQDTRKFKNILIIHGDNDDIVPYQWNIDFIDKLKKANVNCDLKIIEGAGHGFGPKVFREDGAIGFKYMVDFLKNNF